MQNRIEIMQNRIEINTVLGKLCAEINDNCDWKEVFVYIERPDGVQIDLVAAEVLQEDRSASAYLYKDTSSDCYTNKHRWSEEEIN